MADGSRSLPLQFDQELVVDLFAGGGGASLGIARAYRHPDVAVNHSPIAIAVHRANHPEPATDHKTCDVFEVDPITATGGRPVAMLWASPDCRHHSKAKGGAPRSKKVRALAWVVIKWAKAVRPRVIRLENVEEFADWGPLNDDGRPCLARKGDTFRQWKRELEKLGYVVEHRELRACDYGAPTIRKRLYLVARCDGRPIVWPQATHAAPDSEAVRSGRLLPWRTAAECIDWTLPSRSIFDRPKPLADNTQRRIAKGLWRYVFNSADPFIVGNITPFLTEHANASNQRVFAADEPLRTQCAQVKGGHFAMVAPTLIQTGYGEREGQAPRSLDLGKPLGTVVAGGVKHAVATAFLEQANGGFYDGDGRDVRAPVSTICTSGANQRLVTAYLVKYYGVDQDPRLRDPMHTVTTKDRFGLVQVTHVPADTLAPELRAKAKAVADFLHRHLPEHFPEPADLVLLGGYVLADITLRMLAPRELATAQGFDADYVIDRGWFIDPATGEGAWKPVTKTDQVRLIGNSVCPDVAEALVRCDLADLITLYREEGIAA
ncbi:MAG: DNA cytosine methyltransferase [Lysobacter sp.]